MASPFGADDWFAAFAALADRLEAAFRDENDLGPGHCALDVRVAKAVRYIEAHYEDPHLTLRQVAEQVGLSFTYLAHVLTLQTGDGFVAHLRRHRVAAARRLLEETVLSVKEIAGAIGYRTTRQLERDFKRLHGTVPRAVRRAPDHRRSRCSAPRVAPSQEMTRVCDCVGRAERRMMHAHRRASAKGAVMSVYTESPERESTSLFTPESPFLETPATPSPEAEARHGFEDRFWEADSPFLHDVYTLESATPLEAEFSQLLAEMYDESFNDAVRELAAEAVAHNVERLSVDFQDTERSAMHAEQVLHEHFAPLAEQTEMLLEQLAQAFARYDVHSLTEQEVDRIGEQFLPTAGQLTPTFEDFLGKIFKKATGLVKGAVNLAKKGIGALGKLGLGPILKKLKGFVWPLLKRVVNFALGKLPANLRPLAQKLASKLLGMKEAEAFDTEGAGGAFPAAASGEHVQFEFDIQAVQLLFAADEAEMEQFVGESAGGQQEYVESAATCIAHASG